MRLTLVPYLAGWRIRERIGNSLWEIHAGRVPQYEDRLAMSVDRFFHRLRVDSPVKRFNYTIDTSSELWRVNLGDHDPKPDEAPLEDNAAPPKSSTQENLKAIMNVANPVSHLPHLVPS